MTTTERNEDATPAPYVAPPLPDFTPGPWSGGQSITAPRPGRPEGSYDRTTIAQRVNRFGNALLISAAPEMAEIIRELATAERVEEFAELQRQARNILSYFAE